MNKLLSRILTGKPIRECLLVESEKKSFPFKWKGKEYVFKGKIIPGFMGSRVEPPSDPEIDWDEKESFVYDKAGKDVTSTIVDWDNEKEWMDLERVIVDAAEEIVGKEEREYLEKFPEPELD